MFDWVIPFAQDTVTFNSIWGFLTYWLPMLICMLGYTIKTIRDIKCDREERYKKYYTPTTVGDIVARMLATICPVVNLVCAVFDLGGPILKEIGDFLSKFLDIPLVPKKYVE